MVTINEARVVDAGVDRVWEVISDVDKDQEYWNGLTYVRNLKREGNVVEREVAVGFIGRAGLQRIELRPRRSLELEMSKGPLRGSRKISLTSLQRGSRTRVEVSWSFEFSGVPDFAQPFVRSQLEQTTKEALSRIAAVAEGGSHASTSPAHRGKRLLK